MLNFFRQKGLTSIIYGVIIVGMILVFVLGFNPSAGKKLGTVSEACAARVSGSCIEPKAHRAAYRLAFSRGTGSMKQAAASRIVLEGLIERELLVTEAQRLGLTVSDDEITDSIFKGYVLLSLPSDQFQMQRGLGIDDGKVNVGFKDPKTKQFDMKTYERLVKQITGRSPTEFREWQSRELLASKMRDLIRAPVRVPEEEAFGRFKNERTTSTVSYAVVRRSWLEKYGISTDAKDIDAWSKDKLNLAQIKVPVRHVLVKFPSEKQEDKDAAKAKAQGLFERIKKGEDFGKIAKEFSDDPGSKDKGHVPRRDGRAVRRALQEGRRVREARRARAEPRRDDLRLPRHQARRSHQGRHREGVQGDQVSRPRQARRPDDHHRREGRQDR
jgi:peptidyl-prolyl cis-trans isomerase D